jgi:hypothetical protein
VYISDILFHFNVSSMAQIDHIRSNIDKSDDDLLSITLGGPRE